MALNKSQQKALLAEWYESQKSLEAVKAVEMELRNRVVKELFPKGVPTGTNHYPLDDGYRLNAVGVTNYKVDSAALAGTLELIRKKFNVDASDAIRIKHEVSVSKYKALDDKVRAVLDNVITTAPGTPQLEIVKPKR